MPNKKPDEDHQLVPRININDLNQILHQQLIRLESVKSIDDMKLETERTTALVKVANAMTAAGKIGLAAFDQAGTRFSTIPDLIKIEKEKSDN